MLILLFVLSISSSNGNPIAECSRDFEYERPGEDIRQRFISESNCLLELDVNNPRCRRDPYLCAQEHLQFSGALGGEYLQASYYGSLMDQRILHEKLGLSLLQSPYNAHHVSPGFWINRLSNLARTLWMRGRSREGLDFMYDAQILIECICPHIEEDQGKKPIVTCSDTNKFHFLTHLNQNAQYWENVGLQHDRGYCRHSLASIQGLFGNLFSGLRDWDNAHGAFRKSVTYSPSVATNWLELARSTVPTEGSILTAADEAVWLHQLSNINLSIQARGLFHFCLWEYYLKKGSYELAWEQLTQANVFDKLIYHRSNLDQVAKVVTSGYDRSDQIFKYQQTFSAETWRTFSTFPSYAAPDGLRPVFIVGLPRSGSTLLESILSAHTQVFGLGEDTLFAPLCHDMQADIRKGAPIPEAFRTLGERYIEGMRSEIPTQYQTQTKVIVDKQLTHFWNVGFILNSMKHAKIIWIRRNPLDSGLSTLAFPFPQDMLYSHSAAEIGIQLRNIHHMMQHWKRVDTKAKSRIFELHYEQLLLDHEHIVRQICDFLDIPFEQAMIDCHKASTDKELNKSALSAKREVMTGSKIDVTRPIFHHSVGRARPFVRQLIPLIAALGPDLVDDAFQWWDEFGILKYECDRDRQEWVHLQEEITRITKWIKSPDFVSHTSQYYAALHLSWQPKFFTTLQKFLIKRLGEDSTESLLESIPSELPKHNIDPETIIRSVSDSFGLEGTDKLDIVSPNDAIEEDDRFWHDGSWDW